MLFECADWIHTQPPPPKISSAHDGFRRKKRKKERNKRESYLLRRQAPEFTRVAAASSSSATAHGTPHTQKPEGRYCRITSWSVDGKTVATRSPSQTLLSGFSFSFFFVCGSHDGLTSSAAGRHIFQSPIGSFFSSASMDHWTCIISLVVLLAAASGAQLLMEDSAGHHFDIDSPSMDGELMLGLQYDSRSPLIRSHTRPNRKEASNGVVS